MRDCLADHADAMLGALQWEVNESNGLFRNPERSGVCQDSELTQVSGFLIPDAQAWLAGVWWPRQRSSPEPDRFLRGNSASRCVGLVRSGQTRSPSKDVLPLRGPSRRP